MSKYQNFIFDDYKFNAETATLTLHYKLDEHLEFVDTIRFNFAFANYAPVVLDRAFQLLFFLAGVSYYKTYIPPTIVVNKGQIDQQLAAFLSQTYQKGLAEFFYINKLDLRTPINFPVNSPGLSAINVDSSPAGLIVGIGGGKDALVSVELLRKVQSDLITWSIGNRTKIEPVVKQIGLPHAWVRRNWDDKLKVLNQQDAYNGHVPISAIFAATGLIVCILTGKRDNVVSNEGSASEPNLVYNGVPINHQYSKSLEFEQSFQNILSHLFGDSYRYYSFLRPLSEVQISEIFARVGFNKYKDSFSSCNRYFANKSGGKRWCGECAKCAFVFLAFTPFIEQEKLESLWHGKNLLLDPSLESTYKQLLGIEGDKPLDCVGEVKESRAAMRLAQKIYPQLEKYKFDIPDNYDFRSLGPHSMPEEIYKMFLDLVGSRD